MKYVYYFSLFFIAQIALASERVAWLEHCQNYFQQKSWIQKKLADSKNRLGFRNQGGLFNQGVCWWHSRMTRNSQYMIVFDKSLPKPSFAKAVESIRKVREGKPVTIGGYDNLFEFSSDYEKEVQSQLEEWQIGNGGFGLGFIDGLIGSSKVSTEEMTQRIKDLYQEIAIGHTVFQVLQLPGIVTHSWLVIDMQPLAKGYRLSVVDSNYMKVDYWDYYFGQTQFHYGELPFVNYTTHRGKIEEKVLQQRLVTVCEKWQSQQKNEKINLNDFNFPTLDEEVEKIIEPIIK